MLEATKTAAVVSPKTAPPASPDRPDWVTQLRQKRRFGTHDLSNEPKRHATPCNKNRVKTTPKTAKNGDTKTAFSTYQLHAGAHTHAAHPTNVVSHVSPIGKTQ